MFTNWKDLFDDAFRGYKSDPKDREQHPTSDDNDEGSDDNDEGIEVGIPEPVSDPVILPKEEPGEPNVSEYEEMYLKLLDQLESQRSAYSDQASSVQRQMDRRMKELGEQFAQSRNPITPERKRPEIRLGDTRSLRNFMLS